MVKRRESVIKRNVHGDIFLIDSKQNYFDDKCTLYEINEIGEFIWEHIEERIEISDLVRLLSDAVNQMVDEAELLSDVREYLQLLNGEGFLEEYE